MTYKEDKEAFDEYMKIDICWRALAFGLAIEVVGDVFARCVGRYVYPRLKLKLPKYSRLAEEQNYTEHKYGRVGITKEDFPMWSVFFLPSISGLCMISGLSLQLRNMLG
eukprot:TRINITY_DN3976_c0_g1_i1.p1 TRINITY_DN3976_c0_g1~~TRINITY_DN3976_c0_g1_i1.p1  ORF type:complete len:109 (+),score=8.11 TRINITY_DN3976_c0_g1_i1:394-720(+)